jgi:hypothetical protein
MSDEIKRVREFLEACHARFQEAQKRFQQAQTNLQQAQQEFSAAQLEHNNWQGVLQSESRRLHRLQQQAAEGQTTLPIVSHNVKPPVPTSTSGEQSQGPESNDVNKTELVRELLAQHPEGMNPGEVWAVLKNQIARPYVYSILKRLKDADQVIYQRRRKKYMLKVAAKQPEPSKEPVMVQ